MRGPGLDIYRSIFVDMPEDEHRDRFPYEVQCVVRYEDGSARESTAWLAERFDQSTYEVVETNMYGGRTLAIAWFTNVNDALQFKLTWGEK